MALGLESKDSITLLEVLIFTIHRGWLYHESGDGVNANSRDGGREALKPIGIKISRRKTEYIECNFSGHLQRAETTVRIEAQKIPQRDSFRYLGSIISKDGEIDEGIKHRIKAGWLKWRLASIVLCNWRIPTRLKKDFIKKWLDQLWTIEQKIGQSRNNICTKWM